jgi:hypothetical protein
MWSGSEGLQFCIVLGGYYWGFIILPLLVVVFCLLSLVLGLWFWVLGRLPAAFDFFRAFNIRYGTRHFETASAARNLMT